MPTPAAHGQAFARDRLLAAADELFYAEGVQTVVIEHAGVPRRRSTTPSAEGTIWSAPTSTPTRPDEGPPDHGRGPPRQLQLVYDGAGFSARTDHGPAYAPSARAAAGALIDAETA